MNSDSLPPRPDAADRRAPHPPPDPERLAALLDGRLASAERDRLLTELAASDEGLEVLGDAAMVFAQLEREGAMALAPADGRVGDATAHVGQESVRSSVGAPPADRAPSLRVVQGAAPKRRGVPLAVGLATGLAAAAVLMMVVSPRGGPLSRRGPTGPAAGAPAASAAGGALTPALLVARLTAPGPDATARAEPGELLLGLAPGDATRGDGSGLGAPDRLAAGVALGARLLALEVAVDAADPAATALARQVAVRLGDFPDGAPAAQLYRALAASTTGAPGVAPAEGARAALAEGWAAAGLVVDPTALEAGAGLAAIRLAALRGDSAYLRGPEARRAARLAAGLLDRRRAPGDDTLRRVGARLTGAAGGVGLTPPAVRASARDAAALLRALAAPASGGVP
jgi:hypothetical protein